MGVDYLPAARFGRLRAPVPPGSLGRHTVSGRCFAEDSERKGSSVGTAIRTVTREELLERRAEILADLGVEDHDLSKLDEVRPMSSDEWDAREELEQISFLLGEEPV